MALAPGILIGWIYYRSVFFFSFAPWSEQVRDHRTASLVAPGNVFRGDAVAQNRTCKKKKEVCNEKTGAERVNGEWHGSPASSTSLTNTQACYSHDWAKPHFQRRTLRFGLYLCCFITKTLWSSETLWWPSHSSTKSLWDCVVSARRQQQQQQQCCWDTCLQEFIGLEGSLHRKEINTWQSVLYGYITVLKDVVREWIRRY